MNSYEDALIERMYVDSIVHEAYQSIGPVPEQPCSVCKEPTAVEVLEKLEGCCGRCFLKQASTRAAPTFANRAPRMDAMVGPSWDNSVRALEGD